MIKDNREKERRQAFRVDDSLPLIIRPIAEGIESSCRSAMAEPPEEIPLEILEREKIPPALWKMLTAIHRKLDNILERLPVDILQIPPQPVNLSPTGMRLKVQKEFHLEDRVRIKMLLPTLPVKEIVLEGKVVRAEALSTGEYEVALQFEELAEEIKNVILQYTLNRQRQELLAKRMKKEDERSA